MPSDHAYTYVSEDDIDLVLGLRGKKATLDDDASGALSAQEERALNRAVQWATAKVNQYLVARYTPADLAENWVVNEWATVLACYFLTTRRGNPGPASLASLYRETIKDLELIQQGAVNLSDTPTRTAGWPGWSNMRVDPLQSLRKLRVETRISESRSARPDYQRHRDLGGEYSSEPY